MGADGGGDADVGVVKQLLDDDELGALVEEKDGELPRGHGKIGCGTIEVVPRWRSP
ncbi:hypothetical protein ACFV84_04410 [Kitasatospora sp. NPDC059811]|uniref:hypothetical protein n=1 Tax=unclassified Kitasatospora TaxID=2633591 RepID=UPI0014320417